LFEDATTPAQPALDLLATPAPSIEAAPVTPAPAIAVAYTSADPAGAVPVSGAQVPAADAPPAPTLDAAPTSLVVAVAAVPPLPTLPSGKTYELKPGYGSDLLKAQRMANDPNEISYGLIAVLAKVDGKELHLDDVLALDLADVLKLQELVLGKSQASPVPST
jgi:hypothetical protein